MRKPLGMRLLDRVLFGSHRWAEPLQIAIQHLLRGPREASFALEGRTFHCTTAHKYFFEREWYESEVWQELRHLVNRESVVYDFGAHFGYWVVRLSPYVRSIYAFEPSSENWRYLSGNVEGLTNVHTIRAAIGPQEGEVAFQEKGSMSRVGEGTTRVAVVTLDGFACQHEPPDLMLVDIEGYAGEAFSGAAKLFEQRRPTILCEIHNPKEEDATTSLLRRYGYGMRRLDRRDYPFHLLAQ